jgi:hypothetical protein
MLAGSGRLAGGGWAGVAGRERSCRNAASVSKLVERPAANASNRPTSRPADMTTFLSVYAQYAMEIR